MQSPPRLKLIVTAPVQMKIFQFAVPIFIYFISFLYWRRGERHQIKVMLSGVLLECLNERRLRVSSKTICLNEYSP